MVALRSLIIAMEKEVARLEHMQAVLTHLREVEGELLMREQKARVEPHQAAKRLKGDPS